MNCMAHPLRSVHADARPHLVVVGNGMAALRTVEEVLERAGQHYRITVFGAEPHGGYNRILLSSVLAGDARLDDIVTHPPQWYAERGIALHLGDKVVALDPAARTVTSAAGMVVGWDRLVLATGSRPVVPAIPGMALDGVVSFRDLADVDAMLGAAASHRRAVVIGGGVLGLEAAWGLTCRGMEVTVVHMVPALMERQLDQDAAELLLQDLSARGIRFVVGASAEALVGRGRVAGVRLSDDVVLDADLVVVAVGILPEVELARRAGLAVARGVVVDDHMRCSHPDIFAVGECVEHDGTCFGLVMPLMDMARVCAGQLAGQGEVERFRAPPLSTKLKIPGIHLFSAGAVAAANDGEREIVHRDPERRVYKKLVLRHDRVIGAVLYGDTAEGGRFWQWMKDGTAVGHVDLSCCGGAMDVAAMEDGELVCHCNGVTKGDLVQAIREQGLETLDQLCRATRAGTGCGQCRVLAARLLAGELGVDADAEIEAEASRVRRMSLGFKLWHRTNAGLMAVLVLTGLGLHFPGSVAAVLSFQWAHRLHNWSGIGLCAAYLAFLALARVFGRRWRADADGLTLFGALPAAAATGLVFMWPGLLPAGALVPVALAHVVPAVLILMFLIHHLSHAPMTWWRKRKLRALGG
jgi:nitrite reductase (NADH) large subunit